MRDFVLVCVYCSEDKGGLKLSLNSSVQYNWPSQVTAGLVISRDGQLQIRTQLQLPAASRTHTLLYLYFSFCIDLKNYFLQHFWSKTNRKHELGSYFQNIY